MNAIKRLFAFALTFAIGIGAGYAISAFPRTTMAEEENELHLPSSQTALTNPLLECDLGPEYISKNSIKPFRAIIQKRIGDLIGEGKAVHVSYYFRDLNNGSWFGVNEKETFSPASMLKVPLMIHVLKRAESNPNVLNDEIEYLGGDSYADQINKPEREVETGKSYPVRELVERMIIESDNVAAGMLAEYVGRDAFESVFTDLGLATIESNGSNLMSVKNYGAFFRVLFNTSYVSRPLSEAALTLLAQSKFDKGIRAGVPKNVIVAHKFGEREYEDQKQLHDCGIVYQGKNPYLLCIMTRGDNWDNLTTVIRELSKVTYEEVLTQQRGGV